MAVALANTPRNAAAATGARLFLVRLAGVITGLIAWQVIAWSVAAIPGPARVAAFLLSEARAGVIGPAVATSSLRLGLGLLIAMPAGILVGLLVGAVPLADKILGYVNVMLLAMPAAIWSFLALMWFGFATAAPVSAVALTAVPFVIFNIAGGVRAMPKDVVLMSESFQVSKRRTLLHLYLPALSGAIFASLRFAIINGWNAVILSEWFGSTAGVGWRARFWYDANRMEGVAAWIVLFVVLLGIVEAVVIGPLQRRANAWRVP